jgi:uncharacterized protein (DUF1330 family)
MSNKTFLLATGKINPENKHLLPEDSAKTAELMTKGGEEMVSVFMVEEAILGDNIPQTLAVLEFPDAEFIKKVVSSEEYNIGISTRDKCFSFCLFCVFSYFKCFFISFF